MKRLASALALTIVALGLACAWLVRGSSRGGSLLAGVIGRTNVTAAIACSVLGITNRSTHDVAFKVEVEALDAAGWGNVLYPREGPNSVCTGWIGGYSNTLIRVAAPEKDVRFRLTYQRVPTTIENEISWALVPLRIRSPFLPRSQTVLIYPEGATQR